MLPVSRVGFAVLLCGLLSLVLRLPEPIGVSAGMDGAEYLLTTVSLVLGMTFVLESPQTVRFALFFIAVQALLEYGGAGWWKLSQYRAWTSGANLRTVLRSSHYGNRALEETLVSRMWTLRLAGYCLLSLELSAPLSVVVPLPLAALLLGALLIFHLVTAAIMGLNTFVLAYASTFPAILFTNGFLASH
jgi:hypothetical protein